MTTETPAQTVKRVYGMDPDRFNAVADGCDDRRKRNMVTYGTGSDTKAGLMRQAEAMEQRRGAHDGM